MPAGSRAPTPSMRRAGWFTRSRRPRWTRAPRLTCRPSGSWEIDGMATYRIGLEPPSIPRSALPPRRRWPRAMAVVIAAAIMAGVVGAAAGLAFRLSAPERAGQQFLECWERGDLAG